MQAAHADEVAWGNEAVCGRIGMYWLLDSLAERWLPKAFVNRCSIIILGNYILNPHFPSIVDIQCGEKAILL